MLELWQDDTKTIFLKHVLNWSVQVAPGNVVSNMQKNYDPFKASNVM